MVEICYETRIVMERGDGVSIRVGSPLLIFKWVGGNKKGFRKKISSEVLFALTRCLDFGHVVV